MYHADQAWKLKCVSDGLSSGEGLIDRIRDQKTKINKEGALEVVDEGVAGKRLAIVEPEFAAILSVMERAGNTISPVIRKAWDGSDLAIMTRKNSARATAPAYIDSRSHHHRRASVVSHQNRRG